MSDEQLPSGGIAMEAPLGDRVPSENGSRVTTPSLVTTRLKVVRDEGTEFCNTLGILALAVIETADVVGRAAGRTLHQATTDGSRGTFEVVHDVALTAHDLVVDTAQIAVDTLTDLGAQVVRGATTLSRQGRDLTALFSEAGQGLMRLVMTLSHPAERPETAKAVAAVPIIVN